MKLKNITFVIAALFFSFAATAQKKQKELKAPKGYQTDSKGVHYKFFHDEPGKNIDYKYLVSLHMVVKNKKGEVLKNTYKEKGGKKVLFPVKFSAFPTDLYSAMTLLSKGDSASFALHSDSTYKYTFHKLRPENVGEHEWIYFTIKVYDVYSSAKEYYEKLQAENGDKIKEDSSRILAEEKEILKYIKKNKIDAKRTKEGLYYYVIKEGSKEKTADKGDWCEIDYEVKLLDGTKVESTFDMKKSFGFNFGTEAAIEGFEMGINLAGENGTVKLIIPSRFAFLHLEKGKIKPYSILIADLTVKAIRK